MAETFKVFYSTANVYDEYSTSNKHSLIKENFPVFYSNVKVFPFKCFTKPIRVRLLKHMFYTCTYLYSFNSSCTTNTIHMHALYLASKCVFTGVSILNRLNHLPYKFNILTNMVFDTMHTLILRIVLRLLQCNQEKGILKNPLVKKRLEKMPWTVG